MAKPTQAASVSDTIISWIDQGRVLPGDLIDEKHLMESCGVSRTPIREALEPPPLKWSDPIPKPEEIVVKLRQVEVLMGQGMPRIDAIRQISVTEQTYYRWKKKYGGMGTEQLKELKRLQKENERLRRAVSDLTLDKLILREAASGNF